MKMGKEILAFGDTETKKIKFYRNKTLVFIKDIHIEKALVSNKIFFW